MVVEKLPDLPAYRVKPESGMGKLRTLHRDNILAIGELVRIPDDEQDDPLPVTRRVTRTQRKSLSHRSQFETTRQSLS